MSLAVFYVSTLIWAFWCVLVAIVAGAAAGNRTSHWKRALVGLLVGAAFGIIIGTLTSFVGSVTFLLLTLLPAPLNRLAAYCAGTLLSVVAAAFTGLAVGLLEARLVPVVRRCVIVGVAFGLVLGIANAAVTPVWANALIPALEAVGIGRVSAVWFGAATMASGAIVDLALTVVAFRIVRRRWGVAIAQSK